jgi:hypothetical protein
MLCKIEKLGKARVLPREELDNFLEFNFGLRLAGVRDTEPPEQEAEFMKAELATDIALEDGHETFLRRGIRPAGPSEFLGLYAKIYKIGGEEQMTHPLRASMRAALNSICAIRVIGGLVTPQQRIPELPDRCWITVGGVPFEHTPIVVPAVPVLTKGERILLVCK